MIWFNRAHSQNMKTNIEKVFINLVIKYFPKHQKLRKISITNALKRSYCCMKNISSIIKQHTSTRLPKATAQKRERNCKNKDTFHLDSKVFKRVFVLEFKSAYRKRR